MWQQDCKQRVIQACLARLRLNMGPSASDTQNSVTKACRGRGCHDVLPLGQALRSRGQRGRGRGLAKGKYKQPKHATTHKSHNTRTGKRKLRLRVVLEVLASGPRACIAMSQRLFVCLAAYIICGLCLTCPSWFWR